MAFQFRHVTASFPNPPDQSARHGQYALLARLRKLYGEPIEPSVAIRWDEKTGLRTGCGVRSQVIDVLKAQIKRRPADASFSRKAEVPCDRPDRESPGGAVPIRSAFEPKEIAPEPQKATQFFEEITRAGNILRESGIKPELQKIDRRDYRVRR